MKSFIAATALLVAGAAATNHAGEKAVHVVQVSNDNADLFFYPENTIANVGDIVQFQFWPKNHSVVQSTFDKPCVPIGESKPEVMDGFFSGFMPTALAPAGQRLVYSVEVKSQDPMWFYCSQGQHCQGGMVGAINAKVDGERTVASHKALAATAPENKTPQGHAANAPYWPVGTGAPAPWSPTGTGAPLPPTGAPTTFIASPPSAAPSAPIAPSTGGASSLTAGLTGFVGLVAAALAL